MFIAYKTHQKFLKKKDEKLVVRDFKIKPSEIILYVFLKLKGNKQIKKIHIIKGINLTRVSNT